MIVDARCVCGWRQGSSSNPSLETQPPTCPNCGSAAGLIIPNLKVDLHAPLALHDFIASRAFDELIECRPLNDAVLRFAVSPLTWSRESLVAAAQRIIDECVHEDAVDAGPPDLHEDYPGQRITGPDDALARFAAFERLGERLSAGRPVCFRCGQPLPEGQSCGCFDNGCQ